MSEIFIATETRAHIEDTAPKIRVHNAEQDKHLPARSWMTVTYKGENASESSVRLFLDYNSAKALAEGILRQLDEMKYRGELKDE